MVNFVVFSIGIIVFLAHFFQKMFDQTKIPDVLPLLMTGFLMGPVFKFVKPNDFGEVGKVFIVLALAIILFESGANLNISSITNSAMKGTRLTIANFILTVLGVSIVNVLFFKQSISSALILGGILGGISSAVVIPLIGKLSVSEETKTALLLESTFSDVLCIIFTVGIIEALTLGKLNPGLMIGKIISSFVMASIIGFVFALIWSSFLYRIRKLDNNVFLSQAYVFIVYGITEFLGFSGAIASLMLGFTLGNIKNFNQSAMDKLKDITKTSSMDLSKKEKAFTTEIVFLIKTFLFIFIGISIKIDSAKMVFISFFLTLILFALRILVSRISFNKETYKFDTAIAAIMTPKGLAAAVLASIPLKAGLESGEYIQSVVYSIILFSIILTSLLSFAMEKTKLKNVYYLFFEGYKNNLEEVKVEEENVEEIIDNEYSKLEHKYPVFLISFINKLKVKFSKKKEIIKEKEVEVANNEKVEEKEIEEKEVEVANNEEVEEKETIEEKEVEVANNEKIEEKPKRKPSTRKTIKKEEDNQEIIENDDNEEVEEKPKRKPRTKKTIKKEEDNQEIIENDNAEKE